MGTKVKIASIDPNDPDFNKERDAIDIDMEVQRFDENFSGLELPEEVNQKVIGYLEKIIRKSYEYKQYINYLKTELDITSCALIPTLNITDLDISLEFHHYPITLYDIVETIVHKYFATKKETEKVAMFDVMEEVMKEHYAGDIGLVPLSTTMHEMAHSGAIKIPFSSVYGNVDKFVAKYGKYMRPELREKVTNAKLIDNKMAEEFNKKLEKNVMHYNIEYHDRKKEGSEDDGSKK
jgi:hypothetical protein